MDLETYLHGLERELLRVAVEARGEVEKEIGRVKALLRGTESRATAEPHAERAVARRGRPPKAAE